MYNNEIIRKPHCSSKSERDTKALMIDLMSSDYSSRWWVVWHCHRIQPSFGHSCTQPGLHYICNETLCRIIRLILSFIAVLSNGEICQKWEDDLHCRPPTPNSGGDASPVVYASVYMYSKHLEQQRNHCKTCIVHTLWYREAASHADTPYGLFLFQFATMPRCWKATMFSREIKYITLLFVLVSWPSAVRLRQLSFLYQFALRCL